MKRRSLFQAALAAIGARFFPKKYWVSPAAMAEHMAPLFPVAAPAREFTVMLINIEKGKTIYYRWNAADGSMREITEEEDVADRARYGTITLTGINREA